jgi:hypothetical protein
VPHVEQELLTLPEHLSSPSVFSGFVFINDIADNIQSLVRLFADDSSLIFSSTNPLEVEDRLNLDLQVLDNWAKQWLVDFNPKQMNIWLFHFGKT